MTDYEILRQIIDGVPETIASTLDRQFQFWYKKTSRFLAKRYGKDSQEYKEFSQKYNALIILGASESELDFLKIYQNWSDGIRDDFQIYLDEMPESTPLNAQQYDNSKIFIVHGHDVKMKKTVVNIIKKQGIQAIILDKQANLSRTVIEKLEKNSDVGAAICLFTADDIGKEKTENIEKARARQNVIFEAGYFMGKLKRDHTIILADRGIEFPSDLAGIIYIDTADWKEQLLRDLQAIGYDIKGIKDV